MNTKPIDLIEDSEEEIDLIELFYVLLEKWHYIVVAFLLGAVIVNAYSYFMICPTYESTAKLYIVSASNDSMVDLTDLNIGTSLTKDYEELLRSYPVLDRVAAELDLDLGYKEMNEMISLSNPADTRILNVTVTNTDPNLAAEIANTLIDVACDYLPETMSTSTPNIAQRARIADKKADPSYVKFTLIGAVLGLIASCGVITVQHLMDDSIHSAEDMERIFGLVPLATIPESPTLNDGHDTGRTKRKLFKRNRNKKGRG